MTDRVYGMTVALYGRTRQPAVIDRCFFHTPPALDAAVKFNSLQYATQRYLYYNQRRRCRHPSKKGATVLHILLTAPPPSMASLCLADAFVYYYCYISFYDISCGFCNNWHYLDHVKHDDDDDDDDVNQSINQKGIRVTKVTNVTARPLLQC